MLVSPILHKRKFLNSQVISFHCTLLSEPQCIRKSSTETAAAVVSYSYITSMSRISLLLHETEGKAGGRVLITMISYECL